MNAPKAPPSPRLELRGLSLSRGERVLFRDLSAALSGPGVLELRGPNGAGKTSLLLAIAGIIRPFAGTILYSGSGEDGSLASDAHLLLAQNALKARLSVAENLAFWQAVNGRAAAAPEAALERVGLGGLGGIEAGHLSTGQLRRLALARLLLNARPVWLLDEPTAALDAGGETLVAEMLTEHCAGGGIAVVATHHDLHLPASVAQQRVSIGERGAVAAGAAT